MFEAKWEVVVKCAKTFVLMTFVQKQFAKIHGWVEQQLVEAAIGRPISTSVISSTITNWSTIH
jgi:hypothetical protein